MSLTPTQLEAVQYTEGPLLILAGPGSGKTRVLTHRIAHLLQQGVPGRQILAVTFTNKAADEMRLRVNRMAPAETVWIGTFHGFCARMLRRYAPLVGLSENFTIYDTEDSGKALKQAIEDENLALSADMQPRRIAQEISRAKMELIGPEELAAVTRTHGGAVAGRVYPAYQRLLLASNAVDFDDLLRHVAVLLRDNTELRRELDDRFRYVMVDEYQDTNAAQYGIVRALSIDFPNLAVTGDPDQLIYAWRGASLKNILDFERDYPDAHVVRLEQNYRSTKSILRVADCLIANNVHRKEKALYTDNPTGAPVRLVKYLNSYGEADDIADQIAAAVRLGKRRPRDFAIFYRINAMSRVLEHSLRTRGIPYQVVRGLEFHQRKEVKDILAYLHLVNNPANDVALRRIINTPARNIGAVTLKRLNGHALRYRTPLLEAARECRLIEPLNRRAVSALTGFVALYDRLAQLREGPLENVIRGVLRETGYRDQLQVSESKEDIERVANLDELLTEACEFDQQHPEGGGLEAYLETTSLVSDTDEWNTQSDQVTLMTLHAAKGLEFPVVFIVAIEQGVLPHERSKDDPDSLEEERRLLFVGITRAEEELQLSMALERAQRGGLWPTAGSQFLMELPRAEMDVHEPTASRAARSQDEDEFEEVYQDEYDQTLCEDSPFDDSPLADSPSAESVPPAKIMTAAEMHGEEGDGQRLPPEQFRQGMLVKHPDYGPGLIVSLSGEGPKRTARIRFLCESENLKSFRLAFTPLQPMQKPPL